MSSNWPAAATMHQLSSHAILGVGKAPISRIQYLVSNLPNIPIPNSLNPPTFAANSSKNDIMKKNVMWVGAVLISLAIPGLTVAQKTEPLFEITAGNFITQTKFLIQASTGELITGNDMKLFAIDPVSKAVIWENKDFMGLEDDDISVIDGTPFIKIERQKAIAIGKNKNTFIIQARDGKVVYDSKEEGIKVAIP
jgi:hypothetical protein